MSISKTASVTFSTDDIINMNNYINSVETVKSILDEYKKISDKITFLSLQKKNIEDKTCTLFSITYNNGFGNKEIEINNPQFAANLISKIISGEIIHQKAELEKLREDNLDILKKLKLITEEEE